MVRTIIHRARGAIPEWWSVRNASCNWWSRGRFIVPKAERSYRFLVQNKECFHRQYVTGWLHSGLERQVSRERGRRYNFDILRWLESLWVPLSANRWPTTKRIVDRGGLRWLYLVDIQVTAYIRLMYLVITSQLNSMPICRSLTLAINSTGWISTLTLQASNWGKLHRFGIACDRDLESGCKYLLTWHYRLSSPCSCANAQGTAACCSVMAGLYRQAIYTFLEFRHPLPPAWVNLE